MNIERIRQLVAETPLADVAKASKVPLRTVYRFHNGGVPTIATLQALEVWAKGRKLKARSG